jgi:hypothetical protein
MSEQPTPLEFDKSTWGDGPWQYEPDRVEFEHAGLPCLALRNPHGAWCGYVAVPPGHPLHGKDYDVPDVSVHGGLTYANRCSGHICHVPKPGDPDDVWWFGFDCGHFQDLMPGMAARLRRLDVPDLDVPGWPDTYRDLAYVRAEIESLAEQLALLKDAV